MSTSCQTALDFTTRHDPMSRLQAQKTRLRQGPRRIAIEERSSGAPRVYMPLPVIGEARAQDLLDTGRGASWRNPWTVLRPAKTSDQPS